MAFMLHMHAVSHLYSGQNITFSGLIDHNKVTVKIPSYFKWTLIIVNYPRIVASESMKKIKQFKHAFKQLFFVWTFQMFLTNVIWLFSLYVQTTKLPSCCVVKLNISCNPDNLNESRYSPSIGISDMNTSVKEIP